MHTINMTEDFSLNPFGRYRDDSEFSGEAFREDVLIPALEQHGKVIVDLSGTNRYSLSFLNEISEGLIVDNEMTAEDVLDKVFFKHNELPSLEATITDFITKHL